MALSSITKLWTPTHSQYGKGRIYIPDEGDAAHLMRANVPLEEPERKRIAYFIHTVLDQGKTSKCVAFSWKQFLASAPVIWREIFPDTDTIYYESQRRDQWPGENYDGTSVRGGAKTLQYLGFLDEYVWAYDAETVRRWLLHGKGTVVVGTPWYTGMYIPDSRGFVRPVGRMDGGHAYLCFGYDNVRGAFLFVNSWGTKWGIHGRFWLSGEHFDLLLKQNGEACAAVQTKKPVYRTVGLAEDMPVEEYETDVYFD